MKPVWRFSFLSLWMVSILSGLWLPVCAEGVVAQKISLSGTAAREAKLLFSRPTIHLPSGIEEVRLEPKPLSVKEDVAVLQDYKNRYRMFWLMTMTWLVVGFGERGN